MFKMGSHDPFGHLKHKLWPKEKLGIKLAIWLLTTKICESPNSLVCRWHVTYCWKVLNEGYNFASNLISIGSLHTKLWAPKVAKVPTLGILGDSHLGIPGKNVIWMWALWKGIKYTIRGKVVASPKFGSWWVLWVRVYPCLVLTPKVLQLCTNQLVVWFVQIRVND
jgi:hypothetical protein